MQETWQAYVELLTGVTEATRKRAHEVASKLVESGVTTATQLQALTEDLVANSVANRAALERTVRTEIDRALDRVGLVRAEQLQALQERVDALAAQVAGATGGVASRGRGRAAGDGAPAKKSTGGPSAGADAAPKKVARKSVKKAASPDGHRDAADPDGPAR